MDYAINGRRFRAIKSVDGLADLAAPGMAARIREHLRLAHLFADWV